MHWYIFSAQHVVFWSRKWKKICADHEYLQPLVVLIHTPCIYSYILVYARTYSTTIIQHYVLRITLEPPCDDILSLLHACAVHCSQHLSFLRSPWWSGLPGRACHAQTATATGWPHRHCCLAVHPLQPRWHSHTGSLNPCACWTCEELLESSCQQETYHIPQYIH